MENQSGTTPVVTSPAATPSPPAPTQSVVPAAASTAQTPIFTPIPAEPMSQPAAAVIPAPSSQLPVTPVAPSPIPPVVSQSVPVAAPSAVSVAAVPQPAAAPAGEQPAAPTPASTPPAKHPSILDNLKKLFAAKPKAAATAATASVKAAAPAQPSAAAEAKELRDAEKIYQQGLASVKDLIAPSAFEIHFNYINLSGVLARSFFVYSYPRYLDTNWLSPVVNFDATFDISQFVYPIDSAAILRILTRKVAQIQSSITMNREKGNVRDPVLETALEDAESLRTDIQRGQEKFFQFGMYVTVYAEDEKKLEAATKQLESMLAGKLVLTKRADIQNEHAWNATLPLALDELEVTRNMNTSPLSTTFPFLSSDLTSDSGILYGLNRHNDSLVIFDRFSLPNANSVVFASSGAGKSYAVKLEIIRQMMLGTDVLVIDPENEYEELAQAVGGTYLRVSLNSDQRINPFDLPEGFHDDDVQPGELLRSNIITLSSLLRLMLGAMTPAEEALIDKALIDTYAVRGITMETEKPGAIPPPTMEDFHSVLSSMRGAEELAQRVQKYTTGTFGGIFNKPTNVDLNSGLVVFCIRDLEDSLRPIAMFILLNFIWARVRSELKKRILVVDEAWTMMAHDDAAKFMFGLVKRARKYYLGVTAITQDVEDFLHSPYGKPIVTNAAMTLLLKQAPSSMEILKQTFNLTEGEKYMLLNSGVGQGLFFADRKHVAMQIIASYSEHQLVTTNPAEKLKQQEDAVKGM